MSSINQFKKICTKIGISTKPWCGVIVRFWVAFRESGVIKLLIKIFEWLTNKFRQFCKWTFCDGQFKSIVASVVIFIIVYISVNKWFVSDSYREKQMVELVRNGLFGIGALVGLWIAYQRSDAMQNQAEAANEQAEAANEQAKVANEQAKIANRQADLAEKRYASEQFSQSVTLLAKDNQDKPAIEARIGGVYALAQLAEADPKGYGAQVMKTLVAYIRNNAQRTALPSEKDRNKSTPIPEKFSAPYPEERLDAAHLGEDVKTAFAELKRLHNNLDIRESSSVSDEDFSFSHADFRVLRLDEIEWIEKPDLSHANLSGVNLISANLQGARLFNANLRVSYLSFTRLQGADLRWANLQGANLISANLQGADLMWAKLPGADFTNAKAIYTAFEKVSFDTFTVFKFDDTSEKWKIWYDNDSLLLEERDIQPLKLDDEWDLDLIFPKKIAPSDVVFALEGILLNFAETGNNKPGPRAIECRKAVKQWVIDHNLWDHLSDDWREWLKSLDNNYHTK